jgi:hypothetical protein
MSASVLHLPGLTVRIEAGLLIESELEDSYCGRSVLIATCWERWLEHQLDKKDKECAALTRGDQAHLPQMSAQQADAGRKHPAG